jgi:hypothetical protein
MLITPQRSTALRNFQYKGQDLSLLYRYVLSPWAQFLVDFATPTWLAPNAITFLGLAPSVATLCIALHSQPDLGPGMAGWVALLCAGSMFFYSTMDNMDGKQARRTGSSSALGLLFDHGEWCACPPFPQCPEHGGRSTSPVPCTSPHHSTPLPTTSLPPPPLPGCDAINAGLVNWATLVLIAGVPAGSFQTLFWFLIPTVPFFFATWEERHLGVFILPTVNGPNEGIFLCIAMLLTQACTSQAYVWRSLWQPTTLPLRLLLWASAPLHDLGAALHALSRSALPSAPLLLCPAATLTSTPGSYLVAWASALPGALAPTPSAAPSACTLGSAHSGDVLLCLVLLGACATAAGNVWAVLGHVWRAQRSLGACASAAAEAALFPLLVAGLGAWLFHPALHAASAAHWTLPFASAGCLFVELCVRHMLAHVCSDEALLAGGWLSARIAAYAAAPLLALPALPPAAAPTALLLSLAASLLPLLSLCLAACSECAGALGIHVFSIHKQVQGERAAPAPAAASSSSKDRKRAASRQPQL